MKKLYLVLWALLLTFFAYSKILRVPEEYETIEWALMNTLGYDYLDSIVLAPGTYYEYPWANNGGEEVVITSQYYLTNDTSDITNTVIYGSVLVTHNMHVTINDLVIRGGRGNDYIGAAQGGAISVFGSSVILNNVWMYDSYTSQAIYAGSGTVYCSDASIEINGCIIQNNYSRNSPGVVLWNSDIEMSNTIISGGETYYGDSGYGGMAVTIYNAPNPFSIKNCTFIDNEDFAYGADDKFHYLASVYIKESKGIIENCLFWTDSLYIDNLSSVVVRYCNFEDTVFGEGNIYSNPLLNPNYTLKKGSPCIDAGNPDYIDPDGTRSDIGAFISDQRVTSDFNSSSINCSSPLYIQFSDQSNTNDLGDEIIEWNWDFGDGHTSIQQNPLHLYSERGTFTVKLFIKDATNHADSVYKSLDITGNYHVTPDTAIDILDTLELSVDSKVHSISWLEGFQQCSSTIIGLEKGVGNYNYVLSALNEFNCPIADTVNVIIENKNNILLAPQAGFSYTQLFANSDGIIVEFIDTSLVNYFGIPITYWHWDFGDGASSLDKDPIHKYTEQGRYNVTLFVRDEKDSTHQVTQNICVVNTSINYIINNDTTIDILDTLILTYNSNLNNATWSCDLNECSNEIIALEKGLGEFWFYLSANNEYNCGITDSVKIKIENQSGILYFPKAGFTYNQTEITSEGIVMEFVDTSITNYFNTPLISWEWSFGDDENSIERNPVHLYKESGIYSVTLYIKDEQDSTSQHSHDIYINIVGNSENESEVFRLYPNPNYGSFKIELIGNTKIVFSNLYNSAGEKIYLTENIIENSFNFNNLKPDVYLLELGTINESYKRKVVVY